MLLLFAPLSRVSADSQRGGAFLLEEVGARHLGIGGAAVASANDILALYSNTAGLSSSDNYTSFVEFGKNHSRDFWTAVSLAIPIQRRATLAIGYRRLSTNKEKEIIRLTNNSGYRRYASPFHEEDAIIEMGLGRFVRPDLSVGFGARYVSYQASSLDFPAERYQGIHGEFGLRYNSANRGIVVGANIKNFGTELKGGVGANLPLTAALGLSYGKLYRTVHYLNLSADLVKIEDQRAGVRAGFEYWLANFLAVRAGYNAVDAHRPGHPFHGKWSFGGSINFRGALFDIAITPSSSNEFKIAGGLRLTSSDGRRER